MTHIYHPLGVNFGFGPGIGGWATASFVQARYPKPRSPPSPSSEIYSKLTGPSIRGPTSARIMPLLSLFQATYNDERPTKYMKRVKIPARTGKALTSLLCANRPLATRSMSRGFQEDAGLNLSSPFILC